MQRYTFRFDDISLNTDVDKVLAMIEFLRNQFGRDWVDITLAVSPAVFDMSSYPGLEKERVFPKMLNTESDFREFYKVEKVGVPEFIWGYRSNPHITIAAHGMVHVDHRLLSRKAQELSIVTSCALAKTDQFVPPFHKWNEKTERACRDNRITLHKFASWHMKHLLYHKFKKEENSYYLHTHDFTYEQFVQRFSS